MDNQANTANRMLNVIDAFGHRNITYKEAKTIANIEAAAYPDVKAAALDALEGIQSWRSFNE